MKSNLFVMMAVVVSVSSAASSAMAKGSAKLTVQKDIAISSGVAIETSLGGNELCSATIKSSAEILKSGTELEGRATAFEREQQFDSEESSTGEKTELVFTSDDGQTSVMLSCFRPGFLFMSETVPTLADLLKLAEETVTIGK